MIYPEKIKPLLDCLLALVSLPLLSPLFLLSAIAIKLDSSGPVFFLQDRIGRDGQPFKIYKFRTMVVNAPSVGPVLTVSHDPRITRVGHWLRRTSIDELPQLINILKGEMSLIGPRPEVPSIVETYTDTQRQVFAVRPGLTGWAQVHGRDDLSIEVKLTYDLEYVNNLTWQLDWKIFWATFPLLISGKGVN